MKYPIDLGLIQRAGTWWKNLGFIEGRVPSMVSKQVMDWTCPRAGRDLRITHFDGLQVVASAEQSFLQMDLDGELEYPENSCGIMALTPCFRDEVLDCDHLNVFLKLELFSYLGGNHKDPYAMAVHMCEFLSSEGLKTSILETSMGFDVFSSGVELGSYGYRRSLTGKRYAYGTALAEPRTSGVLRMNNYSQKMT